MTMAQSHVVYTIHFATNSSVIDAKSSRLMKQSVLKGPGADSIISHLSLAGHCDSVGSIAANDKLSRKRAMSARNWLIKQGVPDSVFEKIEGFGKLRPIAENSTAVGRSLNRRVEIFCTFLPGGRRSITDILNDTATHIGAHIILPYVNFYGNRHIPLPESYATLNQLADMLQSHPTMQIEIIGFICCYFDGDDGTDMDTHGPLSVERARYVYQYLTKKGIDESRMAYRGVGSSQKIYPKETTDNEKTANRRVEIMIVRK